MAILNKLSGFFLSFVILVVGLITFSAGNAYAGSCSANYSISPSTPPPNTMVDVSFNADTSNNLCIIMYRDGSSLQNLNQAGEGSTDGGFHWRVYSGAPGQHTLQAKYGEQSYYPSVPDCQESVTCNSFTFTTASLPTPTPVPLHIAGNIYNKDTRAGIPDVPVIIQRGNGETETVKTNSAGHFDSAFIVYGDDYAVRPQGGQGGPAGSPAGYTSPPLTTTNSWAWDDWQNKDTPLNSSFYGGQTRGKNDCAGPTRNSAGQDNTDTGRCNFDYKPVTPVLPQPPTNPTASCPTPGTIANFNWTGVSGSTRYDLYAFDTTVNPTIEWDGAKVACGAGNRTLCQRVTGGTSYSAGNLTPGHNYQWYVFACNSAGCSSIPASYSTSFTCVAPTPPSCLNTGDFNGKGPHDAGNFDVWKDAFTKGLRGLSSSISNCSGMTVDLKAFNAWRRKDLGL